MSDQPFYAPGRKAPAPRPRVPGEPLFSFRLPDHRQVDVELRTDAWGVDVQILIAGAFSHSHRFETRDLAVQWAELERAAMLQGVDA